MWLKAETKQVQEQLAKYCRTGIETPIEGTRADRLPQYRRLIFNGINETMQSAFPITKEWLSNDEWHKLVYDFFSIHNSQTPSVWKLPKEFAEFGIGQNYAIKFKKPALNDLLWFEWLEIEVHTMPDGIEPIKVVSTYTYQTKLCINPYFRIQQIQYPIHQIKGDEAVNHKGEYYILIFRKIDTGRVQFLQLSPLHVKLLQHLNEAPQSLKTLLPILSALFGLNDMAFAKRHLTDFCKHLLNEGALFLSHSQKNNAYQKY